MKRLFHLIYTPDLLTEIVLSGLERIDFHGTFDNKTICDIVISLDQVELIILFSETIAIDYPDDIDEGYKCVKYITDRQLVIASGVLDLYIKHYPNCIFTVLNNKYSPYHSYFLFHHTNMMNKWNYRQAQQSFLFRNNINRKDDYYRLWNNRLLRFTLDYVPNSIIIEACSILDGIIPETVDPLSALIILQTKIKRTQNFNIRPCPIEYVINNDTKESQFLTKYIYMNKYVYMFTDKTLTYKDMIEYIKLHDRY